MAARVVEIGTGESVYLVERLAERIAEALLAGFPLQAVEVTLRKVAPAVPGHPEFVGVSITRHRSPER